MKRNLVTLAAASFVAATLGTAMAAEPGTAPNFPPGLTIGIPVGANPPEWLTSLTRLNYYSSQSVDDKGKNIGIKANSAAFSPQVNWTPGFNILGASYSAFVSLPIVSLKVSGRQNISATGFANPIIMPAILSWMLAPGIFASVSSGVYLPIGTEHIRNKFTTFEQGAAISYLRDGWNITAHAVFNSNTTSTETKYRTGDRLYVNFTAVKSFDKWEFGPVAYYAVQTSNDTNKGFSYGPFKPTFGKSQQVGLGLLAGYNFGPVFVKGYVTTDVYARSASKGTRGWIDIGFPLWINPAKLPPGAKH